VIDNSKVVVVTGGARGIGRAYGERFAEDSTAVLIAARLDEDGEPTAAAIGTSSGHPRNHLP